MSLVVSSVVLTLAWFAAVNAVASVAAAVAVRRLRHRVETLACLPEPQVLLAVRLLPFVSAIVVALSLFLPVHLMYEPRGGTESFGALLWGGALISAMLACRSLIRVSGAIRASRRLRRGWLPTARADGRRIVDDHVLPGVSLAGIIRTTIVVGRPVREALTDEELDVAVAHEVAHRVAWDNLKRFAMFASADLFAFTGGARWVEQQWATAVECLADARAVDGDTSRAAHLASALLKVARLARARAPIPGVPVWSTFHEPSVLELRVRRLVTGVAPPRTSVWMTATALSLAVSFVGLAWFSGLPRLLHVVSEGLVRALP